MLEELKNSHFPEEILGFSFIEYLTIFIGLIYALAVAEYFISLANLLKNRHRIIPHWEFFIWMILMLETFIFSWYIYWYRLENISAGLANFFAMTLPYLIMFLMIAIYFPRIDGNEKIDLKEHLNKNFRLIFALLSIYMALNIFLDFMYADIAREFALITQSFYLSILIILAFRPFFWLRMITICVHSVHLILLLIYL